MRISFLKFISNLILFLFFVQFTYALNVEVNIDEESKLLKLLNGAYSLTADGELSIHNPSNVSKIYEFRIPISLDSLIGISKVNVDSTSEKFKFSFNEINGYIIEPNETIKVGYHIYGLLSYDIYKQTKDKGISVLEYYIDSYDILANTIINLQKPQQEDFIYLSNGSLNSTPIGNSTRLITAGVRNPTDFNYTVEELKLYRSDVADPFFQRGQLLKTIYNLSIGPFDFKEVDFFDEDSNSQSVYWISSSVFIDVNLISNFKTNFLKEIKKNNGKGSSGGGGGSSKLVGSDDVLDSILVKKEVDKTLIRNGDEFEVILRVVNINDFDLENISLFDEIPTGYEIRDVSTSVKIEKGGLLTFNIDRIEEYGTYIITYKLINSNELKGITYLKPAKLIYDENAYYSDGVLVINDLLPEKKIFVQKEVEYVDDNFARVIIKVKNLGSLTLENLLVSEIIDENVILKEISKVFSERGVWKIKSLSAGEEWEVSYLVERSSDLDILPNVYGIDKSNIYGTLISSEEIITIFNDEPKTLEKVGMAFAVGLLIFYLLF